MVEEKHFGCTILSLKSMLIDLQPCRTDFDIEMISGKRVKPFGGHKLGDYDATTHLIRILPNRCASRKEVLDVAIHEYAHHLMWEAFHFGELKHKVVHCKAFWDCYQKLVQITKIKGYFNSETTGEDSRIQEITEAWFIKEPALMMGLLSHRLNTNANIKNFRCGRGMIEYNPEYSAFLTKPQLEERLKAEVIRILLRHPYRHYSDKGNALIASNITLNENYRFKELMFRSTDFWTEPEFRNQNFEFYYRELKKLNFCVQPDGSIEQESSAQTRHCGFDPQSPNDKEIAGQARNDAADSNTANGSNTANNSDLFSEMQEAAELWEEDDFMEQKIKEIIEWAHTGMQWGTLPANLQQTLIASLKPEIDYRKVLSGFRASVITSDKMLTRFRPSRRYGFQYMGKKSEFTTRLLIAVD